MDNFYSVIQYTIQYNTIVTPVAPSSFLLAKTSCIFYSESEAGISSKPRPFLWRDLTLIQWLVNTGAFHTSREIHPKNCTDWYWFDRLFSKKGLYLPCSGGLSTFTLHPFFWTKAEQSFMASIISLKVNFFLFVITLDCLAVSMFLCWLYSSIYFLLSMSMKILFPFVFETS